MQQGFAFTKLADRLRSLAALSEGDLELLTRMPSTIEEAEETAPLAIARRLRNTGSEPKFRISRPATDGSNEEIDAGQSYQIEPGDVVQVDNSVGSATEAESKQTSLQRDHDRPSESR